VRALLIVCLLAGTAAADARPRLARGHVGGRPLQLRVVEVDGRDVEVSTARAFRTMQRAAAARGVELRVVSGFRTYERQAELYRLWRRGAGHPAARPGYSNHQSGRALDIYITDYRVYEWLKGHAAKFGFKRTVRKEAWHWEYVGGGDAQARSARR